MLGNVNPLPGLGSCGAQLGTSALSSIHAQNRLFKRLPGSRVSLEENEFDASLMARSIRGKDSDYQTAAVVLFEGPRA